MAQLAIKRYATALFDLAISDNRIEDYVKEAELIVNLFREEPNFEVILQSKKVTVDEKLSLIEKIFVDQVSPALVGLMILTVKKSRQEFLLNIFEAFLQMVKNHKGILKATVTSAVALQESQLEAIKTQLENSTKTQIELDTVIDASIIAGLVIRVGDKVVDASIKGKMQTLKKQLTELKLA
ncbi:ATP synthase F1 subunit delta [Cellulosilyticum sp. I15G10I2]|uniref:ATP synthase F1 subunit delta n=1 Tax=Cellulosilyticum sp. I15G10I2 TaxID=1892843 RepID=UPI00085C87F1|nr:ATP synthase F1 subunit delta [Cellulosilyticum sp. I15G10I2]